MPHLVNVHLRRLHGQARKFFAEYVTEYSLSVDNLFIFLINNHFERTADGGLGDNGGKRHRPRSRRSSASSRAV